MALRSVPTNQKPQQDWMRHLASLDIDDVLDELNSRPSGLSDDEVELARNAWGANEMERRDRPPLPNACCQALRTRSRSSSLSWPPCR